MTPTETFAQKFSQKYGFDPAQIMEMILALLQNCPMSPQGAREAMKNPSLMQQAKATRILMNEAEGMPRWRARQAARDLMKEAAAEDDATLEAAFQECCNNNWQ